VQTHRFVVIIEGVSASTARRICVSGAVRAIAFREHVRETAGRLGVLGWVRLTEDGTVCTHAEGESAAVAEFVSALSSDPAIAVVSDVAFRVEGHEQFAIRGVPAGRFVVRQRSGQPGGFSLELEVGAAMRFWEIPKEPSMNPTVKRLAVQGNDRVGTDDLGEASVWDQGDYEQGGRVPWPEALDRGHAVFVLHGQKLRGGFALQRTRGGAHPQWLLIKRRDEYALPA
jgi:acylphosphatase